MQVITSILAQAEIVVKIVRKDFYERHITNTLVGKAEFAIIKVVAIEGEVSPMNETWIKIIEAAYPLFMENGYKRTTTADIAKSAGINESTLFRNFKTKENLFQASLEYYSKKAIQIDFDILYYTGILQDDLKRMIQTMYQITVELIPSYRLLVKRSLVEDEILGAIRDELLNQENLYSHYLTGMTRRGMIKEFRSDILVDLIYSEVFVSAFELLIHSDPERRQEDLELKINSTTAYFAQLLGKGGHDETANTGAN